MNTGNLNEIRSMRPLSQSHCVNQCKVHYIECNSLTSKVNHFGIQFANEFTLDMAFTSFTFLVKWKNSILGRMTLVKCDSGLWRILYAAYVSTSFSHNSNTLSFVKLRHKIYVSKQTKTIFLWSTLIKAQRVIDNLTKKFDKIFSAPFIILYSSYLCLTFF